MRWMALTALTLFIGIGVYVGREKIPNLTSPNSSRPIAKSTESDNTWIFAGGVVEGGQAPLELGFEVSGRVRAVHAVEGQACSEGQVLAELEPAAFELRVAMAQAQLQIAYAERDKLMLTHTKSENSVVPGQSTPNGPPGPNRNAFHESALSKEDHTIANSRVMAAEAALRQEQLLLEQTRLRAPMDGIVLAAPLQRGELVSPSDTSKSLLLVNRSTTRVRAFVEELDVMEVREGTRAVVLVSGSPQRKLSGTVLTCAPYVQPKSHRHLNPGERLDVRVREIIVELIDGDDLLLGLPVEVFIASGVSSRSPRPFTLKGEINKSSREITRHH